MRLNGFVWSYLFSLAFLLSAPLVHADYDINDYIEHNMGISKNFGHLPTISNETLLTRYYGGTTYGYGEDWNLYEYTGPDGGFDNAGNWVSDPHEWLTTWHFKDLTNGDIMEIGDTIGAPYNCTKLFSSGYAIWWGTDDMDVDEEFENQLHLTGPSGTACAENWGWSEIKIVNHHTTHQIPEVYFTDQTYCPAATFSDVIEVQLTQWYCEDSQCNNPNEYTDTFHMAKGFGVIQQEYDNGGVYILKDINLGWITDTRQCAATWIANH